MIEVIFYQQKNEINGFEIKNHGSPTTCAAVSILALNTCNSIEAFTDSVFNISYEPNGGFIKFLINEPLICEKVKLLLNSLKLGLEGIKAEYSDEISIKYKEVQ